MSEKVRDIIVSQAQLINPVPGQVDPSIRIPVGTGSVEAAIKVAKQRKGPGWETWVETVNYPATKS